MAWYKFDYSYGPGSMGRDTKYVFYSSELTESQMEDEARELAHEDPYISNSGSFTWDCEKVESIPAKELSELKKNWQSRAAGAALMLAELNKLKSE